MGAVDLDRVRGLETGALRTQMQDELELDSRLAVDHADRPLNETFRSTRLDLSVLGRRRRRGHERLEGLLHRSVELEAEPLAHHLDRLREADVSGDRPVGVAALELVGRVPDAESQVDVLAEADDIDDSPASYGRDVPADARRSCEQRVENESRIDPRPHDRDAVFPSRRIDSGGLVAETAVRKRQLFARGDEVS